MNAVLLMPTISLVPAGSAGPLLVRSDILPWEARSAPEGVQAPPRDGGEGKKPSRGWSEGEKPSQGWSEGENPHPGMEVKEKTLKGWRWRWEPPTMEVKVRSPAGMEVKVRSLPRMEVKVKRPPRDEEKVKSWKYRWGRPGKGEEGQSFDKQ